MESIIAYFLDFDMDLQSLLKFGCILLIGAVLFSCITRFIFRRQTLLGHAISSSIAVIFIYAVTVLIMTVTTDLHFLVTPLPFVTISQDFIHFFRFNAESYRIIAGQLLDMIILAFLVNLADNWLPKGKNLISWLFWRILTVAIGFLLHYGVSWLFQRYLPEGIAVYAPAIVLGVLMLMLLTGALRFLVGLVLSTVNPVIGALYTFFFASLIGKQVTKSVITTALLSGVIFLLEDLNIAALSLESGALLAYLPFLLLLIPVWYLISKL